MAATGDSFCFNCAKVEERLKLPLNAGTVLVINGILICPDIIKGVDWELEAVGDGIAMEPGGGA